VLGILPLIEYQEYHAKLDEGDALIIYSDGVTEANNPTGDEFAIAGLAETVIRNRVESASAIISHINKDLVTYTAGAPPSDDITLIVARRVAA
jgi:sigma-B regulation protein RsbU (phosphoserine phosphatase)